MTIPIQLTDQEGAALRRKADATGQDLSTYAAAVLKRDACRPIRSIEQIASDIERLRGGPLEMTENQIGDMLETAKHEMRAERNQRKSQ
jgi:hypothetical protein